MKRLLNIDLGTLIIISIITSIVTVIAGIAGYINKEYLDIVLAMNLALALVTLAVFPKD